MQESLHQTADAGDTQSYSGCRSPSVRQRMQETLYQTKMQETLYQTKDAGDTLSSSGCRSLSIRQLTQETLYQTTDAEVSLSDS